MQKTDSELLKKIHIKVVQIEEHMKAQNSRVSKNEKSIIKNCASIDTLEKAIIPLGMWSRIMTVSLSVLSAITGSLVTFIFLR